MVCDHVLREACVPREQAANQASQQAQQRPIGKMRVSWKLAPNKSGLWDVDGNVNVGGVPQTGSSDFIVMRAIHVHKHLGAYYDHSFHLVTHVARFFRP